MMFFDFRKISIVIFLVQLFIILFLVLSNDYYLEVFGIHTSDGPSYINYPWGSLNEILGSHRNFGYPLFLKIIYLIFGTYDHVPIIQISFYFLSVLILYFVFFHYLKDFKLSALIFCSFLLWHIPLFKYFPQILTETNCASLLNLCFALSIIAFRKDKLIWYMYLLIISFLLFQTRTAFVFVSFLLPFWILLLCLIEKVDKCHLFKIFKKFACVCILPIVFYVILRFLLVGHFGIVSLNGILLSGHASTFYADTDNIKFEGELSNLHELIIDRKKKLDPPCNTRFISNVEKYPVTTHNECYGKYVMMNWLAAIEIIDGDKPFDDYRIYQAWDHVPTLSEFFSRYTVNHDNLLMAYSLPIIAVHKNDYRTWMISALSNVPVILNSLSYKLKNKSMINYFNKWGIIGLIICLSAILGLISFLFKTTIGLKECLFFVVVSFSFFIFSLSPVLFINKLIVRFFELHSLYFFPGIFILFLYIFQNIFKIMFFKFKFFKFEFLRMK